jgi:UDP-N-acetylmuramoyl-L-alanyl-D-glutamate--2,6-diaminopimelate ligase
VGWSIEEASDVRIEPAGTTFGWRGQRIRIGLAGRFNLTNAIGAATAAAELGVAPEVVAAGLAAAGPVPGRFELVDEGQPFTVVVDYAHTPDGLDKVLAAARELTAGRVLVVFGSGGDRDPTKRPAMGRAAARGADVVVVTSDNPRYEDPHAIISSVLQGIDTEARAIVEPDRRAAIAAALERAHPGDVVVIAGKGHETTQITGEHVVPFDDREVAREELRAGSRADRSEGRPE